MKPFTDSTSSNVFIIASVLPKSLGVFLEQIGHVTAIIYYQILPKPIALEMHPGS